MSVKSDRARSSLLFHSHEVEMSSETTKLVKVPNAPPFGGVYFGVLIVDRKQAKSFVIDHSPTSPPTPAPCNPFRQTNIAAERC